MPKKTIGKIKNASYTHTFTGLSKEQILKFKKDGLLDPIVINVYTK